MVFQLTATLLPKWCEKYVHLKVTYDNRVISFEVEGGNKAYEPPKDFQFQYLNEIQILNAPDLKDTRFACAFDNE